MLGDRIAALLPILSGFIRVAADMSMIAFALPLLLQIRSRRLVLTAVVIAAAGFLLEHLSAASGVPYGFFTYTDRFALLTGGTPVVIGLAWLVIVFGGRAAAERLDSRTYVQVLIAAAIAVLIDLALDPAAVGLGFWEWQQIGPYYGIPLSNFGGVVFLPHFC
ncbi:MAG: hypothetical protein TR69_WS6001000951 [candidate division WS6 bacterium OLB20]|uniref:Carotenoid biosynthesis protein n=1 Tax=candidate division WS6 bacterium OLB20 TaxID=1617426 RepID=A0A136LZ54_9BACT|nr:MAG: hypothetical protein TR69_WS6001000951 [candidate division WS6 bacterium OLB20]